MTRAIAAALAGFFAAALAGAGDASAEACPPARKGKAAESRCREAPRQKLEPYDPDRMRGGSRPGFLDLGNGTEVRVGGRARMDYDSRR